MKTFCPECGFGAKVDEDGCCVHCGCDAVGPAVDKLISTFDLLLQVVRLWKMDYHVTKGLLSEFRHEED